MSVRPKDKLNNRETITDLEICIANVERGIFALEMDIVNEKKNAQNLEQMYNLKQSYEKDLKLLKGHK